MKRERVGQIDSDVLQGVKEGLQITDSLRNPMLEQYTDQEQATRINVMVQSIITREIVTEVETEAKALGELALINPEVALHHLGGEAAARETMGDAATDKLLGMIERQRGDVT